MKTLIPPNKSGKLKGIYTLTSKPDKEKEINEIFRDFDKCNIIIDYSGKELNKLRGRD